jgi:MYND finger
MRCVGCMDAPDYQPGDSAGSVYCNRDCQTGHWSSHKAHCRALRRRKKLLRTAILLKAALLTYREVVYDIDLTKIEFQDGVLCLYQKQRSITTPSKRGLFPVHLTTNIDHKEAALANNQCTTAMALLGHLTRKLLEGETDPQDYHLGKLGFTFSRGSLDHRSIGHPYWKATDSNKARSWSRL